MAKHASRATLRKKLLRISLPTSSDSLVSIYKDENRVNSLRRDAALLLRLAFFGVFANPGDSKTFLAVTRVFAFGDNVIIEGLHGGRRGLQRAL